MIGRHLFLYLLLKFNLVEMEDNHTVSEVKLWGDFVDETSNFTSPYLLSFDEIDKLSKEFVPCSSNKNVKSENIMTTQMCVE